jgi:ubiquinol-cytochrome c reductase cytochrome c1 subunit
MRYNRIGEDLGLSDELVAENLMFSGNKLGETITTAMPEDAAAKWFGVTPPDLSLVARSKGTDWIYTYLRSFYEDESRIFGVNNSVLVNASMPDVLWSLKQGQTEANFDQNVRDITNFLDYVGEPAKLIRLKLGKWVLLFLGILFILAYLLKKEYWKDVKYGIWRPRD